MNRTFYVHEHRQFRLIQRAVDAALAFLVTSDMVVEVGEHLGSTEVWNPLFQDSILIHEVPQ